ncbi:MAG TPA: sigma-70 family RNA polymerase sigma factor [Gemmataceae bacterium]|nr:sigma-70 family RNA polymerase sigma factor [Gemmataceae bacterium]
MAEIPPTRASLLVRLSDPRDGTAWSQFVELYAPLVFGYARKQGLQDADAADLTQDVLVAVAGAIGRLEYDPARGAFRNWLFTIVRYKLSNVRAARANGSRGSGDTAIHDLLNQYPAPETLEKDWQLEWEDRLFAWASEQVRHEVQGTTWQAFWRTAIDGQSGKQVAGALGLSVTAVYNARSRVRARLRAIVQSVQEP